MIVFAAFNVFAEQADVPVKPVFEKLVVQSFDSQGHSLRSGLGFLWDRQMVISSYSTVQGASTIKVMGEDVEGRTNQIVAYQAQWDLALLRGEEEFSQDSDLASSDTLGVGDAVYFYVRDASDWRLQKGIVRKWVDSGDGYQMIGINSERKVEGSVREAGPIYNASGRIVGWMFNPSNAVPVKTIYEFLRGRDTAVSLSEMNTSNKFWRLHRIRAQAPKDRKFEISSFELVKGTPAYPFELQLPFGWRPQTATDPSRFLLLALNTEEGVAVALRVVKSQPEDLYSAIQRVETMILPNASRAEIIPYSSDSFSGLKAHYEESHEGEAYITNALYTIQGDRFYILTITYDRRMEGKLRAVTDQILTSFAL
jgi:hypothetical protein